jgi:hypothetical protein
MRGQEARRHRDGASAAGLRPLLAGLAALLICTGTARAESNDFLAADWGSGFSSCDGARAPVGFRAAGPDSQVQANGVITCRDDGDAFVYAVDYMNFALGATSTWPQASLQWFGVAAQRQGANGRNDWFFDEVRPIRVQIRSPGQRVAVANLSFRVPKAVLTRARGFGFYAVGGGIFWPILLQSRIATPAAAQATPAATPVAATPLPAAAPAIVAPAPSPAASKAEAGEAASKADVPPVERADWGAGFPTCSGARTPMPLKAASLNNETLLANGIITCADAGDAYVYAVDYLNFSLGPAGGATTTLEWFGCGAQRAGSGGRNDWIFDEAMPIAAQVRPGVARTSVTQLSCRVPKAVLARARGFGFYVVGGGTLWSILLL